MLSVIFNEAKDQIAKMIAGFIFVRTHEVVVGAKGFHSDLLYLHEAGVPSRNIPPRPVLGPALAQREVKSAMGKHMRSAIFQAVVKGNLRAAQMEMDKAGLVGENACKKYITDGTNLAPNAPSTIARKGSSTPLIDTGALLNSITHEVRGK